jgi:SNF2 family DNA or RNA helicase/uncharacterized Zn finger protein
MATSYGRTWWGQKWLETFNGIDYENRLERGRTYANTGRAYDIKISGHVVTARVRGSMPSPYKVKISFKEFDQTTQEKLKKIVTDSPLILSQLLNKSLPHQIINSLEERKIKLFPSSWGEIEASCNCPDSAMPCKHIAAVIYLLCAQIDKNPFTLFEVHNCDLLNLIADYRDGRIREIQKITTVAEIFKPSEVSAQPQTADLTIDLSKICNLSNCIVTILENTPPFYNKNFRDILASMYTYWQTHSRNYKKFNSPVYINIATSKSKTKFSPEELFLEKWHHPEKFNDCYLEVHENYSIQLIGDDSANIFGLEDKGKLGFLTFLDELPSALLHKFCPKIRFFHTLYQYAVILLERAAIIPQILQINQEATLIRWIPALFDSNVKEIYRQLCDSCPADLVVYNGKKISTQEQIQTAVSWMLSGLIYDNLPTNLKNSRSSDVFQLFFYAQKLNFKNFADKETPHSIHQWLSKLYLAQRPHKLYLTIEEVSGEFELIPQVLLDNAKLPISIKKALQTDKVEKRLEILSDLSLIARYLPKFDSMIQDASSTRFSIDDFAPLFSHILPALEAIGIVIVLPRSLHKVLKPKLNLALKSKSKLSADRSSFISLENLLEFNWQIAIGEQVVSIEEFKKILKHSGNLVRLMDRYVLLDEKEIAQLLKKIEQLPYHLEQEDLMQAILAQEIEGAVVSLDSNLTKFSQSFNRHEQLPIPHNLKADLRPYQERGFNWLMQNINSSFGSILADDMGLGKTIQIITVILHLKNHGLLNKKQRVLIVCPTGLLSNWDKEFKKFAPDITTFVYHGTQRELQKEYDVMITSYGLVRSDKKELNKRKWLLLVIDEAQNIKNPYTEQTKAIKFIDAAHKIAMSGTPVENRLLEYWSIFDFTNKPYLGSLKQFNDRYAAPIEKERNEECMNRFKKITAPFILRRLKSDKSIIADLPKKIEANRYCVLTPEQTALYQKIVDASIQKIEATEGIKRKGLVLQLINSLKQVCNHPAQFVKTQKSLSLEQSGKMIMLEEIISEIDATGEKCLIFTQYVEMGEILVKLLGEKMNMNIPFLHGGASRIARDRMVTDFQNPMSHTKFLIISLKAGGTGLNLTAANHVIHYDLWWNPAVENQATDRAYRIGQKRNVMVHRFITTGTFEERIDEMIKSKKELANLTVNHGENWITEMTATEIRNLVDLKNAG